MVVPLNTIHNDVNISGLDMEWTRDEELQLLFAMNGLKPVGLHKYFHLGAIATRLSHVLNREISSTTIWNHLCTIYNFDLLEESHERVSLDTQDFELTDPEYTIWLSKKRAESEREEKRFQSDGPPSIIAVATDSVKGTQQQLQNQNKETDKKIINKATTEPKRTAKRTRNSMSNDQNSPSSTPPPVQGNKRRRI